MARINNILIQQVVETFPDKGQWKSLILSDLKGKSGKIQWQGENALRNEGGVYVWLFPQEFFSKDRCIMLDVPKKGKIEFSFNIDDLERINNKAIVYVGKTADLKKRINKHLTPSSNTAFQVGSALHKCEPAMTKKNAREYMLDNAIIYYHIMDGDDNVANRDLAEMALIAKYRAPFNIKAER